MMSFDYTITIYNETNDPIANHTSTVSLSDFSELTGPDDFYIEMASIAIDHFFNIVLEKNGLENNPKMTITLEHIR